MDFSFFGGQKFLVRAARTMIVFGIAMPLATSQPEERLGSCFSPRIPSKIQPYLEAKFPYWRIKAASDLTDLRSSWELFKDRKCPGIAEGKFEPGVGSTYAFLLVPTARKDLGFRLVVVKQDAASAISSMVIASPKPEDGAWDDWDLFIRRVRLDRYQAPRGLKVTEGILLYFGGGNVIFYWEAGKYRWFVREEVYLDQ